MKRVTAMRADSAGKIISRCVFSESLLNNQICESQPLSVNGEACELVHLTEAGFRRVSDWTIRVHCSTIQKSISWLCWRIVATSKLR